jgi:hypothetical protein
MRGAFPITLDPMDAMCLNLPWMSVLNPQALVEELEPEIAATEEMLRRTLALHPEFELK